MPYSGSAHRFHPWLRSISWCRSAAISAALPTASLTGSLRAIFSPAPNAVPPSASVPFHKAAATVEHFPTLNDFQLLRFGEDYYLLFYRRKGTYEMFDRLVFHGGPGETLEMRFFSESDLIAHLGRAGFEKIVVHREN